MDIKLRSATIDDAHNLLIWRNAEETRRYSFDGSPIELSSHMHWLRHSLALPTRYLLIAEQACDPLGVLRFDLDDKRQAEVSIYLVPGLSGQGLGVKLLNLGAQWVKDTLPDVSTLIAKIMPENIASCRAFEKAGFEHKASIYERILNPKSR